MSRPVRQRPRSVQRAIAPHLLLLACLLAPAFVVAHADAPPEETKPAAEASGPAVEHGPGVEPHAGVDAIYATFRRGYQTLEPGTVADLYTDDAFYLQPNSDVVQGRESIGEGFGRFFEAVGKAGGSLDVTFEILDRHHLGDGVVDVGIFRIVRDGGVRVTRGKFVVVAIPTDDGWRFRLDSFSPLAPAQG